MKCPKCNTKIFDKCCPRCGYLINGININLKETPEKFVDEKNFNKDFDKLYRNENSIYPMLFTGYYLAYHKYMLTGLLVIILKWACVIGLELYLSNIPIIGAYTEIIVLFFLIIYHFFIGATSNTIILFYDRYKIKSIKKRHPQDYEKYLYKNTSTSIVPLLLIVLIYMLAYILIRAL